MSIRCFIAVDVEDTKVLSHFRNVQNRLSSTGSNLKNVEKENIHLTLKFLGDVERNKLEEVKNLVSTVSFLPFNMQIDGVGVFPNLRRPRTIWAGVSEGTHEMSEIYNILESSLVKLGFRKEGRKFSPHITLARVKDGRNRERLVEEILNMQNETFGGYIVDRITLKKSVLTQKGPIYSDIITSKIVT